MCTSSFCSRQCAIRRPDGIDVRCANGYAVYGLRRRKQAAVGHEASQRGLEIRRAIFPYPEHGRDRLREALVQADVALVLEEDPDALDPATLIALAPQAVVIALEPAVEAALERLDDALSSPAFTLVFDEADLAARREGWETQRWARHLAAKLGLALLLAEPLAVTGENAEAKIHGIARSLVGAP